MVRPGLSLHSKAGTVPSLTRISYFREAASATFSSGEVLQMSFGSLGDHFRHLEQKQIKAGSQTAVCSENWVLKCLTVWNAELSCLNVDLGNVLHCMLGLIRNIYSESRNGRYFFFFVAQSAFFFLSFFPQNSLLPKFSLFNYIRTIKWIIILMINN